MKRSKILVVDDEQTVCQLLKRTLGEKRYDVETAESGDVALEKIKGDSFNLLITDLKMPKIDGINVLKEIKKFSPNTGVIMITGYPTVESAVESMKVGAFDYVCKPFDMQEMLSTVSRCLNNQKFSINYIERSELMTLLEISRAIATAHSLDSILELILDSALRLVKARRGSLLLLDEKTRELRIKVACGLSDKVIKNKRIKLNEGICGKVIRDGKPLLVTDIEHDHRFLRKSKSEYKTKSFISFLLVIKYSQKNILGVINITDKISGESFTEREKALLSLLSSQAGAVIENYRLFSQLQGKIKDLRHTIKKLNETQNQLIQCEKMSAVGQMAFDIAHEIRNPLGIVLGGVEFLRSNIVNIDDDIKKSIEKIIQSIRRANNIILDFLKFSRVSKLDLSSINVCELMDEVAFLIKNQASLKDVKITKNYKEKDIQIMADPAMMRQAFFNLCINAIDAMPQGGELTLSIYSGGNVDGNRSGITVEVTDTGRGIPQDVLSKIFDPFFTTKEPGKGTGLGLSIVRLVLDRHKGIINVKSEINKGTKFIIRLPVTENI